MQNKIETERLTISPLDCNSEDVHDMFIWHNDAEIQKYLPPKPFKLEYDFRLSMVNCINRGQKIYIAKLKESVDNVVVCCCHLKENTFVQWYCNPKYRNNGYVTEMISAIIDALRLDRATAIAIDMRNVASQRVAEKAGFVRTDVRSVSATKTIYEYTYKK